MKEENLPLYLNFPNDNLREKFTKTKFRKKSKLVFSLCVLIFVIAVEARVIINLIEEFSYYVPIHTYGSNENLLKGMRFSKEELDIIKINDYLNESYKPNNYDCTGYNSEISCNLLIPNCSTIFEGFSVKLNPSNIIVNSAGYRGEEYSKVKENGIYRIIILGDSSTFGWGVNISDTFPKILEDMLNKSPKFNNRINMYEVINLALPGYDTRCEYEILKLIGLDYNPDLVIITFHSDDDHNSTKFNDIYSKLMKEYQLSLSDLMNSHQINVLVHTRATKMYYDILNKMDPIKRNEILKDSFEKINELSIENGFDVLIFGLYVTSAQEKFLDEFCYIKGWYSLNTPIVNYTHEELRLNEFDPHPSKLYLKEIGKWLYTYIIKNILK